MPTARMGHCAATLPDGRVALFGGHGTSFRSLQSANLLSADGTTFSSLNMHYEHDDSGFVRLVDGRYLLAGGSSDLGVPEYATSEIFNPADSTFTAVGNMVRFRAGAGGAAMNNGKILIASAWWNHNDAHTYGELFDPATNTFSATSAFSVARAHAIVLPTADGQAVILGGQGPNGQVIEAPIELYDPETGAISTLQNTLFDQETGWSITKTPSGSPNVTQLTPSGDYLMLAWRPVSGVYSFRLFTFDPVSKTTAPFATTPALPDNTTHAWMQQPVVDLARGTATIVAQLAGYSTSMLEIISIDLASGLLVRSSNAHDLGYHLSGASITLLQDGRLLMAGGSTTGSNFYPVANTLFITPPLMLEPGDLRFDIFPAAAVGAGARWSIDGGGTWHESGSVIGNLPAGDLTVSFLPIAGWITPEAVSVTMADRGIAQFVSYSAFQSFTLTYTAGANGALEGETNQQVGMGGSGTPVTAVPDANYQFAQWSDGSIANPRTDTNVSADINVTAIFEPVPIAEQAENLVYTFTIRGSRYGNGVVNLAGSGYLVVDMLQDRAAALVRWQDTSGERIDFPGVYVADMGASNLWVLHMSHFDAGSVSIDEYVHGHMIGTEHPTHVPLGGDITGPAVVSLAGPWRGGVCYGEPTLVEMGDMSARLDYARTKQENTSNTPFEALLVELADEAGIVIVPDSQVEPVATPTPATSGEGVACYSLSWSGVHAGDNAVENFSYPGYLLLDLANRDVQVLLAWRQGNHWYYTIQNWSSAESFAYPLTVGSSSYALLGGRENLLDATGSHVERYLCRFMYGANRTLQIGLPSNEPQTLPLSLSGNVWGHYGLNEASGTYTQSTISCGINIMTLYMNHEGMTIDDAMAFLESTLNGFIRY